MKRMPRNAAPQLEAPRPYRDYLEWLSQAIERWNPPNSGRQQLAGFRKPTALISERPVDTGGERYQEQGNSTFGGGHKRAANRRAAAAGNA